MGKVWIDPKDGPFTLIRHGGRSIDVWRERWRGVSALTARTQFINTSGCMRQGGVRLLAFDGRIIADSWAPRLRTRW